MRLNYIRRTSIPLIIFILIFSAQDTSSSSKAGESTSIAANNISTCASNSLSNDSVASDTCMKKNDHLSSVDGVTDNSSVPIKDQVSSKKPGVVVKTAMKTKDGKRKSNRPVTTDTKDRIEKLSSSAHEVSPTKDFPKPRKMIEETIFVSGIESKTTSISTSSTNISKLTTSFSDSISQEEEIYSESKMNCESQHGSQVVKTSFNKATTLGPESPLSKRSKKLSINKLPFKPVRIIDSD